MTDEMPVLGTVDDPVHIVNLDGGEHPTAREEATAANTAAVEAVTVAVSDRAAMAKSMSELAASTRILAEGAKAQADQAAAESRAVAQQSADDAKRARHRSLVALIGIGALVLAVIVGSYAVYLYIDASNHRASVNGNTLKRLDANTAEIKRTNEKIDNYTTGPAAVDGARRFQDELDCLAAIVHHDVLGTPTPAKCLTLGIK